MTSDVIAWATLGGIVVTAIGTAALAWSTRRLARSTQAMATSAQEQARSTSDSVALQREELEAVKTQAKLTEDQIKLARQEFFTTRHRPLARLEVDGSFDDRGQLSGHISYVSGTDPAYKVWVWARHNRRTQGLSCGTLTPTRNDFQFVFPEVVSDMADEWPFRDADCLAGHQLHWFYLGLTWRDIDDSLQRRLIRKSGEGPPEVILDDVALDLDNIDLDF